MSSHRRGRTGASRTARPMHKVAALEILIGAVMAILLAGCSSPNHSNWLNPQGPDSANDSTLAWLMFALAALVFLVVVGLFLFAVFRFRRSRLQGEPSYINGSPLVLFGGVIIPGIILITLIVFSVTTLVANSAPASAKNLTINVTAMQWWWAAQYPGQNFATADEIHIPVGQPVKVVLNSTDVIHSFWVPELNGKTDVIPGRTTTTYLKANKPGVYKGECAEFCGLQHANMNFEVVAQSTSAFTAWLAQQSQPAAIPTTPLEQAGMQNFLRPECMGCHTLRGTNATGTIGPDLTHVGSRLVLAGGALTNTNANLVRFLMDPQAVKPGTKMPDLSLNLVTAQALAAYFESLK